MKTRRVLVTSSRMPFSLDIIRKLGKSGLAVFASDTFASSPGLHSRYVTESFVHPPPRQEPEGFLRALELIIEECQTDLVIPTFEEVFYLAKNLSRLSHQAEIFAPSFDTLVTLHDKARFVELAAALGVRTPRTIIVRSRVELAAAANEIGEFIARPAYSRGGLDIYTNTGPLAGTLALADCMVAPHQPWLVQEFVHGEEQCSFSVVQRGRLAAHSTYVHPKTIDHAGGIVFESIESPESIAIASQIAEATDYHGHLSFDFIATERGLVILECNPRPTAGVTVMSTEMYVEGLLGDARDAPLVAPAGHRRKLSAALIRDMVLNWREIPSDIAELFSDAEDVYAETGDLLPGLYQVLSYAHVSAYRKHLGTGRGKSRI